MERIDREFKLVFNPGVAKRLLEMGVPISSLKPDKENKDKTVFVFKRTPEFEKAFSEINSALKNKKAE